MENEKNAFYVVKKGDIVGVYKSLNDCQALLGSSVCDPSVSVSKGYCLPKEAEDYLVSHGLKSAVYSIGAACVQDDLFGQLAVCPFQQPASSKGKELVTISSVKRLQHEAIGSTSIPAIPQIKHVQLQNFIEPPAYCDLIRPISWIGQNDYLHSRNALVAKVDHVKQLSCFLEFDGASKGNPGLAGAGAVLSAEDGSMVWRLREGIGIATNNVAEYRAVILGLNSALKKGFKHIRVRGDSKLVCMQVQGLWKTKTPNMADLCKVVKELKDKFMSFEIRHIERDLNSAADAQANLAVYLKEGEVQEECDMK